LLPLKFMNSTSLLFRFFMDQVSCKLFGTDNIDIYG
jgi:hypothetical protein